MTVAATSPVTENNVVLLRPFSTSTATTSTVQFLLVFSEDISGVDLGDFSPIIERPRSAAT